MDTGTLNGIIIILLIVAFIGLTIWAYSKGRRAEFDEAARLPFADDPIVEHDTPPERAAENRHDKGGRKA
ncbi:CcoQ/FixQ family Cbb3-type cytochrome c oxidase assembly chaperone [Halomonas caseinilytica]|mgnify:CR=1 FL=1|uniref:Cytochrome c oxidase cbb3-type subunit 4 n=1 Tax=Halomonas caseinilytica TaxID=438744 RepID=A0A1M6RPK4_9GAMM|nr:CcoQ/FixQ family Cbb3-type cytochrome c oxidase assembly chaperone [Halomonas caseinilytica]SEM09292.1 cytochrome c oxidase cbb3-type subunit 4 [Halomonas caseinilytica]SHK34373.1 cytochrome c oxidase cbb3-type subunit 4 [Halomonas caseinilytica]